MFDLFERCLQSDNYSRETETIIKWNQEITNKINQVQNKIMNGTQTDTIETLNQQLEQTITLDEETLKIESECLKNQKVQIHCLVQFMETYFINYSEETDLHTISEKLTTLLNIIAQSKEKCIEPRAISIMETWVLGLQKQLQGKLKKFLVSSPTKLMINLEEIKQHSDLIDSNMADQYVSNVYGKIISYDVPSKLYHLRIPKFIRQENGRLSADIETIQFGREDSNYNFENIYQSVTQTELFVSYLEKCLQCLKQTIEQGKRKCLDILRSEIDYILPYLSLDQRKTLLALVIQEKNTNISLYDLLVRLKLKGQDGDMLASSVQGLIEKVRKDESSVDEIITFLEICQTDFKSINMGFYVSNELIQKLQDEIAYSKIKKLLELREEFRTRIHGNDQ